MKTPLHLLLVSAAKDILSECERCFNTSPFQSVRAQIEQVEISMSALSDYCSKHPVDAVIADGKSEKLPFRQVLECATHFNDECSVYALFDALDEEAITTAIQTGATSFALKSNLSTILSNLQKKIEWNRSLADRDSFEYPSNSHQILRALLEESTDSIWAKNLAGKYLLINPAGAKFLGKPIRDIIGKTDYEVFPYETAKKIRHSDHEVIAQDETQTVEDLIMTLDGVKRTFQAVKGIYRDENGKCQGLIGTVRDITARKQAENALQESERRFRLLVEGVKDHAIYMLDPDGRIITWNIGAERLQGYQAQEIIGKDFSCFYLDKEAQEKALQLAIEQGSFEEECIQIRKDGSQYWSNVIITPLYDESPLHKNEKKTLIGFSNVIRDITEWRKSEAELKYYAAKLEQSNQELEHFAFIASHDLQAPLRKINIFAGKLQHLAGMEGQDTARRMQGAVAKMQQLVSDLLILSRVNRKGKPFQAVNLNQIIASVVDDLEVNIKEQQAHLIIDELALVYGDDMQLRQLFQNLLSNSLKFKKPGVSPEIHIHGHSLSDGFYQVRIQDNGIGFQEQYLEKIFRPFERLHGESRYPGSGMGLAICQKVIERHGGQITAQSQEGKGATFILQLPTSPPKHDRKNQNAPALLKPPIQTETLTG